MSAEFVDTNILVYAHDGGAEVKHEKSVALLDRLVKQDCGALSMQVLTEFYAAATRKLNIKPEEVEEIVLDLQGWALHRPAFDDLVSASRIHRRHKISWWDALIVHSATELGCTVLWTEDLTDRQKYGDLIIRNPFGS